jgi:hypothetical protein
LIFLFGIVAVMPFHQVSRCGAIRTAATAGNVVSIWFVTSLAFADVTTSFTLSANFSVFTLSSMLDSTGLTVQMTDTLAFPEREGCNILVSFESRNGIWLEL